MAVPACKKIWQLINIFLNVNIVESDIYLSDLFDIYLVDLQLASCRRIGVAIFVRLQSVIFHYKILLKHPRLPFL